MCFLLVDKYMKCMQTKVCNYIDFINQISSCSNKDASTHKYLRSVIEDTLMNKLSHVNTRHYRYLVFLLQYHLIIMILTSKFPN